MAGLIAMTEINSCELKRKSPTSQTERAQIKTSECRVSHTTPPSASWWPRAWLSRLSTKKDHVWSTACRHFPWPWIVVRQGNLSYADRFMFDSNVLPSVVYLERLSTIYKRTTRACLFESSINGNVTILLNYNHARKSHAYLEMNEWSI